MTQNVLHGQATLTRYSRRGNGSKPPHIGLVCIPRGASIGKTENRAGAGLRRTVFHIHADERLYDLGWRRNFYRIILSRPLFKEAPQS